jgi:hypothetical protein
MEATIVMGPGDEAVLGYVCGATPYVRRDTWNDLEGDKFFKEPFSLGDLKTFPIR